MDKVIEIIGKVVLSVGGAGVVIIAISSYISKIWADIFMKKKSSEYDKQIECYKGTLELEREKYKALNEQIIYKNQRIFDTEFKIYQEITPKLIDTADAVIKCTFDNTHDDEYMNDVHNKAKMKCKELYSSILRYACFMNKDMYKIYADYYFLCMNNMGKARNKDDEENNILPILLTSEVEKATDDLLEKTREYLRSIATIK